MDREKLRAEIAKAISRRHGYGEFVTTLPDADAAIARSLRPACQPARYRKPCFRLVETQPALLSRAVRAVQRTPCVRAGVEVD